MARLGLGLGLGLVDRARLLATLRYWMAPEVSVWKGRTATCRPATEFLLSQCTND